MAAVSWDTPSPAHSTAQRDSPGALGFPLASRRAGVSLAGSVQSPLRRISPALQSASSRLRFSFFMVACGSISGEEIQPPRKPPERQSRRRALSKPATAYSLYSSPKAPGGQAEGSAWRCIWKCWVLMSTWTKPPQTQPAHIPGEAPGLFPRALAHCGQSELPSSGIFLPPASLCSHHPINLANPAAGRAVTEAGTAESRTRGSKVLAPAARSTALKAKGAWLQQAPGRRHRTRLRRWALLTLKKQQKPLTHMQGVWWGGQRAAGSTHAGTVPPVPITAPVLAPAPLRPGWSPSSSRSRAGHGHAS